MERLRSLDRAAETIQQEFLFRRSLLFFNEITLGRVSFTAQTVRWVRVFFQGNVANFPDFDRICTCKEIVMPQQDRYAVSRRKKGDVQTLCQAAENASLHARLVRVSVNSDVDYFQMEYENDAERELYNAVRDAEEQFAQIAALLRERLNACLQD